MAKGIGLLSGGLDSLLAFRILLEQGIEILGVTFITPFFSSKRAEKAAQLLSIPLEVLDITEEHMMLVQSPPHGYGKNMNPCIDCHALMFRSAGKIMEREGGDFLFSGEVLDERPMSQNRRALEVVSRESGFQAFILRPLSALLLPETLPEKQGKVDRTRLLAIRGRSRKPQLDLAKKYGITDFPTPAGGCLLTEPRFCKKLKDLLDHTGTLKKRDLELLKLGRHLRLSPGVKVIVGRNEEENRRLRQALESGDLLLYVEDYPGPDMLIPGGCPEDALATAASICVRYSDAPPEREVRVAISRGGGKIAELLSLGCSPQFAQECIIH